MPALVRIGSVDVRLGDGTDENLNDYSLSKAAPTMETVEEVIQLFESGGTVSACVRWCCVCPVCRGSTVCHGCTVCQGYRVCLLACKLV